MGGWPYVQFIVGIVHFVDYLARFGRVVLAGTCLWLAVVAAFHVMKMNVWLMIVLVVVLSGWEWEYFEKLEGQLSKGPGSLDLYTSPVNSVLMNG